MTKNVVGKCKSAIKNLIFSATCAAALYYISPDRHASFWLSLVLFFLIFQIAEVSTEIFNKIAKSRYKKWINSILVTAICAPMLAYTHLWLLLATPIIFLFTFFGGFTKLSHYLSLKDKDLSNIFDASAKCENCGEYPHQYRQGVSSAEIYTKKIIDLTTNPAYSSLGGNIHNRNNRN